MPNSASKVVVGANGTVSVAAVGTAAPTNSTTALNALFKSLGFLSEDGVQVAPGQTINPIMAWQSAYAIRKIVASRTLELNFTLREFDLDTIPFAFGGGTLAWSAGAATYTPPAPEVIDTRALVVDWLDGTRHYRLYVPNGQVTDLSAFTLNRGAPAELPIKFELNSDGVTTPWTIFSDDIGLSS